MATAPIPNITAYVASSLAQAQSWQATVDAAAGYPSVGVDVGGGRHVPGPIVAPHYVDIVAHPNGIQWAVESDAVSDAALLGATGLPAPLMLDTTWFPVQSVMARALSAVGRVFRRMFA